MKAITALDTLATLNAQQTDAAAQALGLAVAQRNDAQQRLVMLQQLRDEYERKLQQQTEAGLSFAAYRNFQAFLLKIDDAIRGQQQITSNAAARADGAQVQWQDKRREGMTWEALQRRAASAALAKADKHERKLTDEFAARAFLRTKEAI